MIEINYKKYIEDKLAFSAHKNQDKYTSRDQLDLSREEDYYHGKKKKFSRYGFLGESAPRIDFDQETGVNLFGRILVEMRKKGSIFIRFADNADFNAIDRLRQSLLAEGFLIYYRPYGPKGEWIVVDRQQKYCKDTLDQEVIDSIAILTQSGWIQKPNQIFIENCPQNQIEKIRQQCEALGHKVIINMDKCLIDIKGEES